MCLEEKEPFPEIAAIRKERERFDAMSCSELREYLGQNWDVLQEGRKQYLPSLMVGKGCQEAVPFLLRQLKSDDPFSRMQALHGLTELNCREHRQHFIDCHLNDPDETVRTTALIELCVLFRNERDLETCSWRFRRGMILTVASRCGSPPALQ